MRASWPRPAKTSILALGEVLGHKSSAHTSVRAWWWQWKHFFKVKLVKWTSHLPLHTCMILLVGLLWKVRSTSSMKKDGYILRIAVFTSLFSPRVAHPAILCSQFATKSGPFKLRWALMLLSAHAGLAENPTDAASTTLGPCWQHVQRKDDRNKRPAFTIANKTQARYERERESLACFTAKSMTQECPPS